MTCNTPIAYLRFQYFFRIHFFYESKFINAIYNHTVLIDTIGIKRHVYVRHITQIYGKANTHIFQRTNNTLYVFFTNSSGKKNFVSISNFKYQTRLLLWTEKMRVFSFVLESRTNVRLICNHCTLFAEFVIFFFRHAVTGIRIFSFLFGKK